MAKTLMTWLIGHTGTPVISTCRRCHFFWHPIHK